MVTKSVDCQRTGSGEYVVKTGLSAREAQSLKIRDSLLRACGDLLFEQPIDAITINEIVQRAGVAKGSFYNHFPDKEALATTVSDAILMEVRARVRKNNENVTDPAYRIVRGMCTHIQLAVCDPRRAMIMLRGHDWASAEDHHLHRSVKEDVSEGIASGRFARRCDDVGVLQIMGTGYISMIRIVDQRLSVHQAIDLAIKAISLILCGFGLEESEAVRIVSDSARDIIKL
jgi:AcrR family transcriptional regulator